MAGNSIEFAPKPNWDDKGTYVEPRDSKNARAPRVEVDNATTYIDKDGANNMIFVDAVTGSKTLAELAVGGAGGNVATDTIWDAAGDLAVGTGVDAASIVNIGAEEVVARIGAANVDGLAMAEQTVLARLTGASIDDVAIGIADNNIVQIDQADVADNDIAKFTANGLEGRSYSELKTDLSLNNVENTAHSTDAHTMTIDGIDVSAHDIATTGVHGVGAGTIAKTADITATKIDDLTAGDDNTDLDVSTTKHGLAPKAVAPAAGMVNVYGITNGETAITNKALFDATNPAAVGTAAPGTATAAARRDHVHPIATLVADLNFGGFRALALALESSATVPASPIAGQLVRHTPTGRDVTMEYSGAAWIPIISLGTMTIYVDNTDGTDAIDKGGAVDAGAFKTIQYAVNLIPGLYGGNVIIYPNDETYAEDVVIRGKQPIGNYTITVQGTLVVHDNITMDGNGVQGTTTTQASVHEHGMTTNHYQNQLLKFTSGANNGLYRIIDSNTDDGGTANIVLCGAALTAQPLTNDTASVYTWGTTITRVLCYGVNVLIYDTKINSSVVNSLYSCDNAWVEGYRLNITGSVYGAHSNLKGCMSLKDCLINTSSSVSVLVQNQSYGYFMGVKFTGYATSWGVGIYIFTSIVDFKDGCVIDGVTKNTQDGIYAINSYVNVWAGTVYEFIRMCDIGIHATLGATVEGTSCVSYSGCDTNESATAAQYAYID